MRATVERERAQRVGAEDLGMERGSGAASEKARSRRGDDGMGQGVGQRGREKADWQKLLPPKGFVVLPRRWVVERTIAWIEQNRRMSKDYERLCASGEALIYAAMIRLMTRRLARV
jgi:transposase